MKKFYESPEMEVTFVATEDIMVTSAESGIDDSLINGGSGSGDGNDWGDMGV